MDDGQHCIYYPAVPCTPSPSTQRPLHTLASQRLEEMRERGSESPPGVVTTDCSLEGIPKDRRDHMSSNGRSAFYRVSSDEGSDEGSISLSSKNAGDDDGQAVALACAVPATASCSGKAVVSDSEHDDSSSSDSSSLVPKNDSMRDSPLPSDAQCDDGAEEPGIDQSDGGTDSVGTTPSTEHDVCRKRPKKRRRLDPGQIDYGGTLVCSNDPAVNQSIHERKPDSNAKRIRRICSERERSKTTHNFAFAGRTKLGGSGGEGGISKLKREQCLRLVPGSIVQVLAGIYKDRRGIVKRYLPNQVLVRVPAFSFQIDRWFERHNLRVLEDCELLQLLNLGMPRPPARLSDAREYSNSPRNADGETGAQNVYDLDRIEPLPVNFDDQQRGWLEDGNVDRDGLAAFVTEAFDPSFEPNETIPVFADTTIDKGSSALGVSSVRQEGNASKRHTECRQKEDTAGLFKNRMTPSSFDLQETLDVVTKVIDEVAVAQRNSPTYEGNNVETSGETRTSGNAICDSVEAANSQQRNTCSTEDGFNGYSCDPDHTSEFVDSSIVEAFAPSVQNMTNQTEDVCPRKMDSSSQQDVRPTTGASCDVATDCEELLGDLDEHIPTGMFTDDVVNWTRNCNVPPNNKWSRNPHIRTQRETM